MASHIDTRIRLQHKIRDDCVPIAKKFGDTYFISKGNIIEGIEAKE